MKKTIVELVDSYSGENVNYEMLANLPEGAVDGVIYARRKGIYYKRVLTSEISPVIFGADSSGQKDSTVAFQKAINFCLKEKINLKVPFGKYLITDTVIIPVFRSYGMIGISLDFGNSEIILVNDKTFLRSSNWGTGLDSDYSNGIKIANINFSSPLNILDSYAVQIQDYHQGCILENMSSFVHKNFINTNNAYYMKFLNLRSSINAEYGNSGERFKFDGAVNLNTIKDCLAVNSNIAYKFTSHGVTALDFSNNSVEGVNVGLQFDTEVYSATIKNCYIENFGLFLKTTTYVHNLFISENYINRVGVVDYYLYEYTPVPGLKIKFDETNYYHDLDFARFLKTKENDYGADIYLKFFGLNGEHEAILKANVGANVKIVKAY